MTSVALCAHGHSSLFFISCLGSIVLTSRADFGQCFARRREHVRAFIREGGPKGAEHCLHQMKLKADSVLGLATGSTPIAMYERLIVHCTRGDISFNEVQTFNLDEYIGISAGHPQNYRRFMQEHLFDHIDIPTENTHIPSGVADPVEESTRYETKIVAAGEGKADAVKALI